MNGQQRFGMFSAVAGLALLLGAMVGPTGASAHDSDDDRPLHGTIVSHNTPGWNGPDCDSSEWHWVIVGLKGDHLQTDDAPRHIHVAWSNGTTTSVGIDKLTGGAAHYSTTAHLRDGVRPTRATADWPSDTHVTAYNNFNLSHGPCTTPPVTDPPVTDPPVTDPPVTDPPVTDPPETNPPVTDPPETNPPETDPPVTNPPETTATPTTAQATTTTTVVANEAPTTPTTAGAASGGPVPPATEVLDDSGALPTTGGGVDARLPMLGGMLLTFGLALMVLARRPATT